MKMLFWLCRQMLPLQVLHVLKVQKLSFCCCQIQTLRTADHKPYQVQKVLHLQSVQVRRDRTGRKMDQFLTEMLILAEYMSLYLVLPVMIAGFQSPMVSWFLSSSLCMMMFAGALRLMLMQAVNCSTAAFLAVLIHIVLKVINNWVFLAGTPLLDTPAGVWIRWGISILGYFLFLMNRKWDYDQKRTDAD